MNAKIYSILALVSAMAIACGEDGDAGPAGPAGPTGPTGATGADGQNGAPGQDGQNGRDLTAYDFRSDAPDAYVRVDRMGMPAVSTALIADKNAYNDADPNADATLGAGGLPQFVESDIAGVLGTLHEALRDDLAGAGLTRCSTGTDATIDILPCATQEVAPGVSVLDLIVPDTLTVDPTAPAGFPNGRRLEDPVMDVTLAVILLDLTVHPADALVGVLNPAENDVPFLATFPYLAFPVRTESGARRGPA